LVNSISGAQLYLPFTKIVAKRCEVDRTYHICPPTGIYAMYNQLRGKKQVWEHLDTGHVSRRDYEAPVREEVLAYLWVSAAR
jgi:hypothetical protein